MASAQRELDVGKLWPSPGYLAHYPPVHLYRHHLDLLAFLGCQVLLAHSDTHLFTYRLWLFSHCNSSVQ